MSKTTVDATLVPGPGWVRRSLVQPISRKRLAYRLSKVISIAQDHQNNGLAAGASEYRLLHQQTAQLIHQHADRFQLEEKALYAQLPAMAVLEKLAKPQPVRSALPKVIFVIIMAVALPALAAIISSVYSSIFEHVQHLFS